MDGWVQKTQVDSSPPGQNGRHFADNSFMNEKFFILIHVSLKLIPNGPIDDKPLPEPTMTQFTNAYMRR